MFDIKPLFEQLLFFSIGIISISAFFSLDVQVFSSLQIVIIVLITSIIWWIPHKEKLLIILNSPNEIFFKIIFIAAIFLVSHKIIDYEHYSYYIGPIYDVIKGKSLLYDTPSQYGYLSIHFLALIFHFIGFTSNMFQNINILLFDLSFLLVYYFFHKLISNRFIAFFCSIIYLSFQSVFAYYIQVFYPSTGPLRFGLGLILIVLLLKPSRKTYILSLIITSISFFWSAETAIYVVPAWLFSCLAYSYSTTNSLKKFIRFYTNKIITLLIISLIILSLIILFEIFKYGTFPILTDYLQFIPVYKNGVGAMPIAPFGNYYLVVLVLICGVVTTTYLMYKKIYKNYISILSFISFYNITIFSYFVGRSHENNITNISGFVFIEFVLLLYLFLNIVKDKKYLIKLISLPVIFFIILFSLRVWTQISKNYEFIRNTMISNIKTGFNNNIEKPVLIEILQKYHLSKFPIILLDERDTGFLIPSKIVNTFPFNPIAMTFLLPNSLEKYIDPKINNLSINTVVIITSGILDFRIDPVWKRLQNFYYLKKIGEDKNEKLDLYQIIGRIKK